MTDESARLLTFQQQLEKESDGKTAFFGLSVNETMRTCLLSNMSKRADKIKVDFKVPEKRSVTFCGISGVGGPDSKIYSTRFVSDFGMSRCKR